MTIYLNAFSISTEIAAKYKVPDQTRSKRDRYRNDLGLLLVTTSVHTHILVGRIKIWRNLTQSPINF